MCGIVGIFGKGASKEKLNSMLIAQKHRGPDFQGEFCISKKVALGHNRLAIIDLNSNANQPMYDNSNRYIISFNGEIYNYLELKEELKEFYNFKTNSDTEVLLVAYIKYKEKVLDKLNGMFSFIIYDTLKNEIFGARDRFGVKPFYYMQKVNTLYIASEIKTFKLANINLYPNEKVWSNYLSFGSYGKIDETFWNEVYQLKAGEYLTYKENNLKTFQWYDFKERVEAKRKNRSLDDIQKEYEELLIDSVKLRFRADVNVGFNLSGGVDSSTLLAIVNKVYPKNKNINAYTFYTNNKDYDELFWVEKMVTLTNNPLKKVLLNVKDIPKLAKELYDVQYEPYGGIPTIAYFNLFKESRKDNRLVLLDGQGMDEQWAGYDYYTLNSQTLIQGVKSSPTRVNTLSKDFLSLAKKEEYPELFNSKVENLQYRDLFFTKIPRALRFNDRVSMASSVELREPFLDYRLVEFAFIQPLEYKIRNNQTKWLLREIAKKHLNTQVALAPKRPLQTPMREWLGKELILFVEENLDKITKSKFKDWFNTNELQKEWQKYKNGNQDNAFFIWQWISLGLMIED